MSIPTGPVCESRIMLPASVDAAVARSLAGAVPRSPLRADGPKYTNGNALREPGRRACLDAGVRIYDGGRFREEQAVRPATFAKPAA